jgi:hypothetical protein
MVAATHRYAGPAATAGVLVLRLSSQAHETRQECLRHHVLANPVWSLKQVGVTGPTSGHKLV